MPDKASIALQFVPQQLNKGNYFSILYITKSAGYSKYDSVMMDYRTIQKAFPKLQVQAKEYLNDCGVEGNEKTEIAIENKYKSARTGVDYLQFHKKAMERELHHKFVRLKPFLSLFKLYHKIWVQEGKALTAPCKFSTFTPQLQFEVLLKDGALLLQTNFLINGSLFDAAQFKRYQFFIESGSEYFILGLDDTHLLDNLEKRDLSVYAHEPNAFIEEVLAPLEKKYTVNRNGHFSQTEIDEVPVNRVMLSEISESFLVLTPQWHYGSFLIEGPWVEQVEIAKEGKAFLIKRNKGVEQDFIKLLQSLHPNFSKQLGGYYYLNFAEAQKKQWFLKVFHSLLEQDIEVVGMDMLKHFRYSTHKPITTCSVIETKNETLLIQFKLSFGDEKIPLNLLQKILLNGQKAILLKDGSMGILGESWLQQYGSMLKHGKVTGNQLEVASWMALTEEHTDTHHQVLRQTVKDQWWAKWREWQKADEMLIALPDTLKASLRQYQQKGFEWLVLLSEVGAGACLADDMGLGKTLQTIAFFAYHMQQSRNGKYLVICPASLIYNWESELQKFLPGSQVIVYHGALRNKEKLSDDNQAVIITTYGTLRSDIALFMEYQFDVAVLDESHNIKNPAALTTKTVLQVKADMRIALSGTPVLNNTFDLFAQLNFLLPGMFGSREFFKREYADAIDVENDSEKIKALQKLTGPFILRRTKEQVAKDLPDKVESVLWCEMGEMQRMHYDAIKENVRNSVFLDIKANGFAKGKLSVLNAMLKLRQVCNASALIKDNDMPDAGAIKLDVLTEELLNIIPHHKALVFSQFTGMLDLIEPVLSRHHIPYCRLDGSTPLVKRKEIVESFQWAESVEKVFLISLKAGNAGLNLTAADYVFLIDPWWNTAVEQQAIDRTHRIGQTKNIFAYKMICKDTIEEKIMQLQQRKKKLAAELIGEEEGFVKSLTEEDIEFLLS